MKEQKKQKNKNAFPCSLSLFSLLDFCEKNSLVLVRVLLGPHEQHVLEVMS